MEHLFNSIYLLSSISKITGVSRGFCFVQFSSIEEAKSWIDKRQVETTNKTIFATQTMPKNIYKTRRCKSITQNLFIDSFIEYKKIKFLKKKTFFGDISFYHIQYQVIDKK